MSNPFECKKLMYAQKVVESQANGRILQVLDFNVDMLGKHDLFVREKGP